MKKNEMFVHVATMGTWKASVDIIRDHIDRSGIVDYCDAINFCVCGDLVEAQDYITLKNPKEKLLYLEDTVRFFEFPTINLLYDRCCMEDMNVFYIHTKGASYPSGSKAKGGASNHLDNMAYNCISLYKECVGALDSGYDCSGYALYKTPFVHYCGNAWWATSHHVKNIKKLDYFERNFKFNPDFPFRHDAEKWICSYPGKFHCMWNTYKESKFFGLTYT